ncbi:hypothetical protein Tco_0939225 [Tanacetum coccineum]|uniref:Uncharacterized protein n=1 Tax=Tanacetum coccineum TaxID=301880 RepID=A0ABQ5DJH8_9ASTR
MLRAFPMSLTGAEVILFYKGLEVPTRQILDSKGAIPTMIAAYARGPHYTKDSLLKEEGKTLEEAYYTQFGVSFPQGGQYRAAAPGFHQKNNANPSYQERVFNTWMAFGENTRDLGSFREETDEITDLHQILEEVLPTECGDGVTSIK